MPTLVLAHQKPKVEINWRNFLLISWLSPLLYKGTRSVLIQEDLPSLPDKNSAASLSTVLKDFWDEFHAGKNPSLYKHMQRKYLGLVLGTILFQGFSVACQLSIPTFLTEIINFLTPGFPRDQLLIDSGIWLGVVITLLQIGVFLFLQTSTQLSIDLQVDFRTILISSLYSKSLRLSQKSSRIFTQGQILNSINVDVEKVSNSFLMIAQLFVAPIQIAVSIVLLARYIGVSVWGGAGSLFGILFAEILVIGLLVKYQQEFLKGGDRRLKALRELLYGIKIIKFRGLEEFFSNRISKIRKDQMSALAKYYSVQTYFVGFIQIAPIAMPISAFLIYAALNGDIRPNVIFPSLTLFNGLFQPILTVPQSVTAVAVAVVSWNRICEVLAAEEGEVLDGNYKAIVDGPVINLNNVSFQWDKVNSIEKENEAEKQTEKKKRGRKVAPNAEPQQSLGELTVQVPFSVSDVTLSVARGTKVGIVGVLGSGKSSFLSGIIGEMPRISGEVSLSGKIGYCGQQPWILTDTIKGNIIFNHEFDEGRLSKVIEVCGLQPDLDQFPAGLETEIGEKGVNLSGGQKARVALARALYSNPDILLLDDPISALDAQVGRLVFEKAIKSYCADKTVLLVTHQLHLVPELDFIVVFENGQIVESGTFQHLMETGSTLKRMMLDYKVDKETSKKQENELKKEVAAEGKGGIIVAEDQEKGSVNAKVFLNYFDKCGGWLFMTIVVIAALSNSASQVFTNLWLSWWASRKFTAFSTFDYMKIYGLLGVAQFFFALCVNTVFLTGCYRAAKYYHPKALSKLLRSPMGFFDSQPIGRILNRMSKDVESIDQNLWILLFLTTIATSGCLASLAFLCYVDQRMLILAVPLIIIFFYMLKFFQRSNIEFKRFEAVNRSPLYAHVSESLAGISTLKAYRMEDAFIKKQLELMDFSNVPTYLRLMAACWISLRLGFLSSSLTFLLCVLGSTSALDPSLVGLSLTYAIGFINLLSLLLTSSSQLENEFNSVERLDSYCERIPEEPPAKIESDEKLLLSSWPTKGEIVFDKISLSYPSRPDVLILKELSFKVNPGENIGVIGRTGSGKSTLMTALFRLVELKTGSIVIDGVDISKVGLLALRKSMQIIPQEPVLFSGTIRENLDVEGLYQDSDIWQVLEQIGLKDYVSSLAEKLESPVVENGENLSVGQRQLICLGRAVLVRPKILIMDEATASVDGEADKLIQVSIKKFFKETTVISIAHRLNTIADFDRILVLDQGELKEYDSPKALLSRPDSLFSQLADATGASNAQLLRSIAGL